MQQPLPLESRSARSGSSLIPWALVVLAFGLRIADAALASFHLDDFHSLHHARADNLGAFFEVLAQDNHPPLSFLVLWTLRSVFGEGELILRVPNVLYGTAAVWLAWRLARRLGDPTARVLGTTLFALSSLHLDLSSDLRMYALLSLAVLGVVDALLDLLDPLEGADGTARARLRLVLWTAAALLSHYHALHAAAVVGLLVLVLAVAIAPVRRMLVPVLWCAGLGALLASPWYLSGFREQLGHELAPGGSAVSLSILGESLVHLVFVRLDLAGGLRPLLLALGLATLPLALVGTARLFATARRRDNGLATPVLLAGIAFLLPAWTALVAWLQPRAGFEWRYLGAAIAPFCLLVGVAAGNGVLSRPLRMVVSACVAGAAILSVAHVRDHGREDYRAASAHILKVAVPGDGVLGVEWQPRLFPRGGGWWYYAGRLGPERAAALVPLDHTADFHLSDEELASELPRVHCLLRSIPDDVPLLKRLRAIFPREEKHLFGEAVWVLTFSRE